jgi:dextranase
MAVCSSEAGGGATLHIEIRHLDEQPEVLERPVELAAGEQTLSLQWTPPGSPAGYCARAELRPADGSPMSGASTAFDVLPRWTVFPRYGFLSDFSAGRPDADETLLELARFHVNGLQFYDWQYRHEELIPPTDEYRDPLGRSLSLRTVRELVARATRHGMAAMPYLAVYAASMGFWREHSEWALYDASGKPILFGGDFLGLMNPEPEGPWAQHLLAAADRALREIAFDGLHIDQYGEPKRAWNKRGEPVDLPASFVGFVRRARQRHPDHTILFNAVGNWPINALAEAPLDFLYIEVWPPEVSYADLARIVLGAAQLSRWRAVVIALYLPADRPANVLLADAVILACGGTRIELGEGTRLLADPYFPKHQAIGDELRAELRRFYDYMVRCGEWIRAYQLPEAERTSWAIAELDTEFVTRGGTLWAVRRALPRGAVLSLVNLSGLETLRWDTAHPTPSLCRNLDVGLRYPHRPSRILWSCPERETGPQPLDFEFSQGSIRLTLPEIHYTGLITIHD